MEGRLVSNQWLRLWHDMPNDPKWRTIARISGQRIGDVQAVYMHLLTSASQHVTRGHADVTAEDLASAIDVTDDAVQSILDAMQGRVLDGMRLTGWEKRQPKREDSGNEESGAKSSAERKRLQREREKAAQETATGNQCHGASRNVTADTDTDTDTEPEKKKEKKSAIAPPDGVVESVWTDFVELRKSKKAKLTQTAIDGIKHEADSAGWTLDQALRECCSRGWTGFKASWVADKATGVRNAQPESFKATDDRVARARWEEMTGRTHPDSAQQANGRVIDITPKFLEIAQ